MKSSESEACRGLNDSAGCFLFQENIFIQAYHLVNLKNKKTSQKEAF